MNNCPICRTPYTPLSRKSICPVCHFDLSGDFTLMRSLALPSPTDEELLLLRRESILQRQALSRLQELTDKLNDRCAQLEGQRDASEPTTATESAPRQKGFRQASEF